mmetsp:Transcript_3766/g.8614  ORF Transcript_3766/g.8614 Transcript_3766/m.8614 type:complete len:275 (+) Transcript_3766:1078-1902(+)
MSLKTRRPGTSAGCRGGWTASSRSMRSTTVFSKSVLLPQGALASSITFWHHPWAGSIATHEGLEWKVRMRLLNAGCASRETMRPKPMHASMGMPLMLPETSQTGTICPRVSRPPLPLPLPLPSPAPLAPSAAAAAAAAISLAFSSRPFLTCSMWDSACASTTDLSDSVLARRASLQSASAVTTVLLSPPFFCAASKKFSRHATRPGSSGNRSPVAGMASPKLPSFSFKKALRWRRPHSEGTSLGTMAAQRPLLMYTSVTRKDSRRPATAQRYFL